MANQKLRRREQEMEGYRLCYELNEKGKQKPVLVYEGPYYGVRDGAALKRLRLLTAVDVLLFTILFFLLQFFPGTGGMIPWIGVISMLAVFPLFFLYMGLFSFLTSGEKWTLPRYRGSYRRIRRSAWGIAAIMGYTTLAHLAFLFLQPDYFPGELYYTAGAFLCTLLSLELPALQKKCPAVVVQGPAVR